MLTVIPAHGEQYDGFLQLMREQTDTDYEAALKSMGLTWEEYAELFRARGEVYGIYSGEQQAGFYWIELRDDILHLHGLILKDTFHGKGIGTAVLKKLEHEYSDRAQVIELGVDQSNVRAKTLYEQLGYETVKVLDEVGFYVMQKPLRHEKSSTSPA